MKRRIPSRLYLPILVGVLLIPLLAAWAASGNPAVLLPGITERVSLGPGGVEGNGWTQNPSISADGRYVAFQSLADNFAPGDWNEAYDIFVFDRETEMLEVITQGWYLEDSEEPVLSADGRFVAFGSYAGNLVPGDTYNSLDVFVYDRQADTMEMISVSSTGQQGGGSAPVISADGRYVAFHSPANNLVGGDWNSAMDIFVRDRQNGTTELVSMDSNGQIGSSSSYRPSISADGRFVAFSSYASNLVPGDTNGEMDIFVHDRQTGITERVSVSSDGEQANDESSYPSLSADGRYVSFTSFATNLVANDTTNRVDIFVHDRWMGTTVRVSLTSEGQEANYHSDQSAISADGRYVSFASSATNLAPGLTYFSPRIFVHDRQAGATELVSVGLHGQAPSGGQSVEPDITGGSGYEIVFGSAASNLVISDTNGFYDAFVRSRPPISLTLNYSDGAPGSFFSLAGSNFPMTATATIAVNGVAIGSIPTDSAGNFVCRLDTTGATPGLYKVTATALPSRAIAYFVLEADGIVRPLEGSGPILPVPPFTFVYAPAVFR